MSKLSDDDVRYVARLSKFDLTEQQHKKFKHELESILGYIDKLQEADVDGVEPTAQVTGLTNVMREDLVTSSQISQAELLKNAPSIDDDNHIQVKKVL